MNLQRFALFLVALVVPLIAACASGSAIVTGTTRAAIQAEQVRIYLEPPTDFETVALVTASSDAGLTDQGSIDYAVAELKLQAAKLGANGVLVVSTGDHRSAKTVQGKAIFVKRQ